MTWKKYSVDHAHMAVCVLLAHGGETSLKIVNLFSKPRIHTFKIFPALAEQFGEEKLVK